MLVRAVLIGRFSKTYIIGSLCFFDALLIFVGRRDAHYFLFVFAICNAPSRKPTMLMPTFFKEQLLQVHLYTSQCWLGETFFRAAIAASY